MEEIFKKIKGFPNYYVSNLGNVKLNERILKPYSNQKGGKGYLLLTIYNYNDKQNYKRYIHRLVAQVFIPNPENKPCVNHRDGNKKNNNVNNLEWATYSENMYHAVKNNLTNFPKGKNHKLSKKVVQLDLNRKFIKIWESTGEIKRELGIPKQSISSCCNHKNKQTHNYIFMWLEEYNVKKGE